MDVKPKAKTAEKPKKSTKKKQTTTRTLTATDKFALATSRDYAAVIHTDVLQKNRYVLGGNETGVLSAREQKVVLAVVSRIKPDDRTLEPQDFDIYEFCDLCGIRRDGGRPIKDMLNVLNNLSKRVLWLYQPQGNGESEKITIVHWLQKVVIQPGKKKHSIRIYLDEDMAPFLIGLRKNYTKLYLHDVLKMNSKYSILLYQILSSYAYMDAPIAFDLRDLQERLDCVKSSYVKNFNAFNSRVLTPSVEEINRYSSLKVTMYTQKVGRAVSKVVFKLKMLRDSTLPSDQDEFNSRYERVEEELHEAALPMTLEDVAKTIVFDATTHTTTKLDDDEDESEIEYRIGNDSHIEDDNGTEDDSEETEIPPLFLDQA